MKAGNPRQTTGVSQTNISGPINNALPSQYSDTEKYPQAANQIMAPLFKAEEEVQLELKGRAKVQNAILKPAGGRERLAKPPATKQSRYNIS